MKKLFLLPIIFLILLGCNKEEFDSIPHGYYTQEYKNCAWGIQHSGWIIDSDGKVMSFDKPNMWNDVDLQGYISKDQIIENIANCDKKINRISKKRLLEKNKLIKDAALGTFSDTLIAACDKGKMDYYYCYLYDNTLGMYKKIRLSTEGDDEYHNESSAAKTIDAWMKDLN